MSKASKKKESLKQCIMWFIIIALLAVVITGIPYKVSLYIFSIVPTEVVCIVLGSAAVILALISAYLELRRSRSNADESETQEE